MSALNHREHFATELRVWSEVVPYLPLEALVRLRHWLRLPNQVDIVVDSSLLAELRAAVLNSVCRRLVDDHRWPAAFLVSTGDLQPEETDDLDAMVPGDISALMTEDGGPDAVS